MSIGARLREERTRLGLTQSEFAALAGASKSSQVSWEKDQASPNAVALVSFADAGADVSYILFGSRQGEDAEQFDPVAKLQRFREIKSAIDSNSPDLDEGFVLKELRLIAIKTPPSEYDNIGWQVDDLLKDRFGDEEAAARRKERMARRVAVVDKAIDDLAELKNGLGIELGDRVENAIIELMVDFSVPSSALLSLIGALRRRLSGIS